MATLAPNADSVYRGMLSGARTLAAATGMKITDDRSVPGIGAAATLLYTVVSGYGRVELVVLQRNAVVTVHYQAATRSGYSLKDVPPSGAGAGPS
ncbi:hypothetical protein AB0F71_12745 [Kitasatospora sp. NPDC028055]|uniref:hypothetical protein n=1 Tax=Kitasatospora sp. NPDC028055 TaxID=3155653 RepID=UPI0033CA98C4